MHCLINPFAQDWLSERSSSDFSQLGLVQKNEEHFLHRSSTSYTY